jgi:phosphoribosylformylglycinamidine cyclo-ligase
VSLREQLRYQDAGVDRDKADQLVDGIRRLGIAPRDAKLQKRLRSTIGGYASVFALTKDQWIAATTDGVGTKLKLAFESGHHETIGQDLVAMSVNDLICVGARPLLFLDYFATSGLELKVATSVIRGISQACADSGCLLVGGETAEMPGMYAPGEYDLAGFCVGSLSPKNLLPRRKLRSGDRLIGLASSGFHSNGFSLIRKILESPDAVGKGLPAFARTKKSLIAELLRPTMLYPRVVLPVLPKVLAAAHITGSGFLNVPRMGEHVSYRIELPNLSERASVYTWLHRLNVVSFEESVQTFNQGVGMVLAVEAKNAKAVMTSLRRSGLKSWDIGEVITRRRGSSCEVSLRAGADEGSQEVVLEY